MVREAGGEAVAFEADVTREATLAAAVAEAVRRWGRLDVLHYNVGVSIAGGDAPPTEITEEAFDRVSAINLRGFVMAVKHALAGDAGAAVGRDPLHLLPGGGGEPLPLRRLQGDQGGDDRLHRAGGVPERRARHPLQHHPARADGHAHGRGHARPRDRPPARGGGGGARPAGAAAPADGHGLGRGERRAVPGQRRGRLHHRRRPAGGRRRAAGAGPAEPAASKCAEAGGSGRSWAGDRRRADRAPGRVRHDERGASAEARRARQKCQPMATSAAPRTTKPIGSAQSATRWNCSSRM